MAFMSISDGYLPMQLTQFDFWLQAEAFAGISLGIFSKKIAVIEKTKIWESPKWQLFSLPKLEFLSDGLMGDIDEETILDAKGEDGVNNPFNTESIKWWVYPKTGSATKKSIQSSPISDSLFSHHAEASFIPDEEDTYIVFFSGHSRLKDPIGRQFVSGEISAKDLPIDFEIESEVLADYAQGGDNKKQYSGSSSKRLFVRYLSGTKESEASAEIFKIEPIAHSDPSGIYYPVASSSINADITFEDPQKIIDLLPQGSDSLDILMNFEAKVRIEGPVIEDGTIWDQSVPSVWVRIYKNKFEGVEGHASISNGPYYDYSYNHTGIFSELGENGGTVNVTLQEKLYPYNSEGLKINIILRGSCSAMSLGPTYAHAELSVKLIDITLTDGTPLFSY